MRTWHENPICMNESQKKKREKVEIGFLNRILQFCKTNPHLLKLKANTYRSFFYF